MSYDDRRDTFAQDETGTLISSEKVDGTPVYDPNGERLGTIHHFMVGKRDGQVEYAVLSYGGFLGIGERYYPLPWDVLTYDVDRGGYVIALDPQMLRDAPYYAEGSEPAYDRGYGESVYGYYGLTY